MNGLLSNKQMHPKQNTLRFLFEQFIFFFPFLMTHFFVWNSGKWIDPNVRSHIPLADQESEEEEEEEEEEDEEEMEMKDEVDNCPE